MWNRTVSALLFLLLAPAPAAWSHGLERHYGTPINEDPAPAARERSGGSPGFTLLVLETTSMALERALDEGRPDEAVERAQRLPRLAKELERRSQELASVGGGGLEGNTIEALSAAAERVNACARDADPGTIRSEIVELRRLIRTMQESLRKKDPQ